MTGATSKKTATSVKHKLAGGIAMPGEIMGLTVSKVHAGIERISPPCGECANE